MEFRILGPLQIVDDQGRDVTVMRRLARTVAAVLLLDANRPLSAHRLVDLIWVDAPRSAAANLRGYLAHLRSVTGRIETSSGGYLIRVRDGELDVDIVRRLVDAGRADLRAGRPRDAVRRFADALELWRGEVLCDIALPGDVLPDLAQLAELRLIVADDLAAARLATGDYRDVIPDLLARTIRYPLRERPWAQLMVALDRAGEPGAALAAYRRCATVLADELGTEPGPVLRELRDRLTSAVADRRLWDRDDTRWHCQPTTGDQSVLSS